MLYLIRPLLFLTLKISIPPLTFFILYKRSDKWHFIFQTKCRLLVVWVRRLHHFPFTLYSRTFNPSDSSGCVVCRLLSVIPVFHSTYNPSTSLPRLCYGEQIDTLIKCIPCHSALSVFAVVKTGHHFYFLYSWFPNGRICENMPSFSLHLNKLV